MVSDRLFSVAGFEHVASCIICDRWPRTLQASINLKPRLFDLSCST